MGVFDAGKMVVPPLDDTMVDLIFGSVGAVLYLISRSFGKDLKIVNGKKNNSDEDFVWSF